MRPNSRRFALALLAVSVCLSLARADEPREVRAEDGFRGIWYMNQPQDDEFRYKYSGGLGTFPQQHLPLAVYAPQAGKTFFCYGGKSADGNHIQNMVSFYDHDTGEVARPVSVVERRTNDAHYTPSLAIDDAGHIYLFANCHGTGYEQPRDDPTYGQGYIFRSKEPYSIDAFEQVLKQNFSYSQAWPVKGKGLLWMHTRYDRNRRWIYFSTSTDGRKWSDAKQMTKMGQGSYQISWSDGSRIGTAMDYHPQEGGLNARPNIYYLQTSDSGQTWETIARQEISLPLAERGNAALVHDFERDGLLVYLKDLTFDAEGRPVILYITARTYKSGPAGGPRVWQTARWTGKAWKRRDIAPADHNYDHGSLYIEPNGTWRLIAPTEPGPQPHATGGQIAIHVSRDKGESWTRELTLPTANGRNATYIRPPFNAHDDFYAFWADGDALKPSESDLYFATAAGKVYRLPRSMTEARARPMLVEPAGDE